MGMADEEASVGGGDEAEMGVDVYIAAGSSGHAQMQGQSSAAPVYNKRGTSKELL